MVGIQCLYMFICYYVYIIYEPASQPTNQTASQPTNRCGDGKHPSRATVEVVGRFPMQSLAQVLRPLKDSTFFKAVFRHQCMLRVRGSQCKGGAARHSKQTNSSPAPTRPRHTPAHLNDVVHVYTTHILTGYIQKLVVGLEHEFYFPFSIWDNPSHWRTHIFQHG